MKYDVIVRSSLLLCTDQWHMWCNNVSRTWEMKQKLNVVLNYNIWIVYAVLDWTVYAMSCFILSCSFKIMIMSRKADRSNVHGGTREALFLLWLREKHFGIFTYPPFSFFTWHNTNDEVSSFLMGHHNFCSIVTWYCLKPRQLPPPPMYTKNV